MAKTYFKAQPTAAETQINWAEVGKNFSDMLTEEARVREEKKGAIDEASRQYQQTLNDVDQGQSATANQWWLNAAGEMQNQMLMQDRMLKSGALNPRDYTVMRQNLVDGTDGLIGVFGKFNAEFKDRMECTRVCKSSPLFRINAQSSIDAELAALEPSVEPSVVLPKK